MRLPATIRGKRILVRPYTMLQEKEILLLNELCSDKEYAVQESLRILGFDKDNDFELSDTEKKLVLYKYRSLSVGEICSVNFTCDKCGNVTRNNINLDTFEVPSENNDEGIFKLDYDVTDDNLIDFLSPDYLEDLKAQYDIEEIDELDLDVYEALLEKVKSNQSEVNFVKNLKCISCRTSYKKDFGAYDVVLDLMSEDSIRGIYDYTNTLIKFGYTKQDIDSLIPFERTVLTDLIMEDENG